MKFSSALIPVLVASAAVLCQAGTAQTRWCDVRGVSGADHLHFPVIARAAHESGAVLLRVTFRVSGEVTSVEPVSGSHFLAIVTRDDVSGWRLTTDAHGDELCQTLVVVEYVQLPMLVPPASRMALVPGVVTFTVTATSLAAVFPLPAVRSRH